MPAFSFEALDAQGHTRRGTVEADSARAARSQLRAQALVPLNVEPVDAGAAANAAPLGRWLTRAALSAADLAVWTRQLAGLLASGLPLERALAALAQDCEKERQQHLLAALRAEVNAGSSFARALAQHPRAFSPMYCAAIGAGEASGALDRVLERLADELEMRQTLQSKLLAAALYPAIVTVVALLIVLFLLSYVVPQIAAVFAGSQRALPTLTVVMLAISAFVRNYGWAMLAAAALAWTGFRLSLRQSALRLRFDAWWLRLPLLGRLARNYHAARFAGALAMLAGAGVPMLKALQGAADTLGNRALHLDAMDALALVREGAPLASALAQKKRFPPLLAMFARLGEQTGTLPQALQRAADQIGAEVQRRALYLASILEPLLIVLMGVLVATIVLAVLMPIIQMNQFGKV